MLAEHNEINLLDSVYKAITAAQSWDGEIDLLLIGKNTEKVAKKASSIKLLNNIIRVDAEHLEHLLAEDAANIVSSIGKKYHVILAAHHMFAEIFFLELLQYGC